MILPRPLWRAFVVVVSIMAAGAAHADDPKRKVAVAAVPPPGSFEAVIANNPISAILKGQKLWTTPEEPKDWVKATRPTEMNFMPVGITPPNHATKVKTAAELAAATADMEAARASLVRRAGVPAAAGAQAQGKKPAPPTARVRPKPLTAAAGAPD